jgi:hypothetical protein
MQRASRRGRGVAPPDFEAVTAGPARAARNVRGQPRAGLHASGFPRIPQRPAALAVQPCQHQYGEGGPQERRGQHQQDRFQRVHAVSVVGTQTYSKYPYDLHTGRGFQAPRGNPDRKGSPILLWTPQWHVGNGGCGGGGWAVAQPLLCGLRMPAAGVRILPSSALRPPGRPRRPVRPPPRRLPAGARERLQSCGAWSLH